MLREFPFGAPIKAHQNEKLEFHVIGVKFELKWLGVYVNINSFSLFLNFK
jgi:hypothetical protein